MKKLLAALLITAGFVLAQTDQPTFKAGSEETDLDVVVRDKKGRLVTDLTEKDFTILDNGEPRPIKSFRIVQGTEAINSSGGRTQLDPLRQLRLITLVFQGGDVEAKRLGKDAAMELVKGELAQNVYIAVMAIDHKLQAIQPFTNDRDLIKKAILRATATVSDYTSDTIQVKQQLQTMLGPAKGGDMSMVGQTSALTASAGAVQNGPGAGGPSGAANAAMAGLMLNILQGAQADESTDWSRSSIFPLLDLVKEQYRLPGRKTILYFSGGFPITQSTEEPFKQIVSLANRANVSFYCIDTHGLTSYSTAGSSNDALKDAAASGMKNVTSSTTGISMDQARSTDKAYDAGNSDTQNAIGRLAVQTGGSLIANTNDFKNPIRKITEDAQSYYEITYDPQITKYDGSFRKVMVKTTTADLRIQSRAGYFALPPALAKGGETVASYEVPLLMALDTKPLQHDFSFQSAAMHFRGGVCEVVVDIPVGGLTFEEDKTAGVFNGKLAYVAVVKDANGNVVKKLRQEVPMRVTPDKIEAYKAASHFIYNESFNLPPGRYTLEAAVIDMQNQKLSARKSVFVVPAQDGTLGISSVTMIRNTKAKEPSTKPDDPMLMADKIVMPMVNPTLKKSDYQTLPFYLTLYPDKKSTDKPTLTMEFSKDGQMLGKGQAPLGEPDATGRIQYVANAPASALPPGNYQIRFVAAQGSEQADETVTFTLEP
jgi:VWFA-related protein